MCKKAGLIIINSPATVIATLLAIIMFSLNVAYCYVYIKRGKKK